MPHSIWSGSISFGLINIPVTMYSAARERVFDFQMLRKNDLCPISFKRVCRSTGEEVPYSQIVKGYEYREGDYVILHPDDFKRADPKESELIDIQQFVEAQEIDTKYFKKPYYLEPGKGGGKAYVLLREALDQAGLVAVAKMIFRDREDLVALKPEGNLLLLNQLRFADELRSSKDLKIPVGAQIRREEIKMALQLIDTMKGHFKPEKYTDTYVDKLKKLIAAKAKGKKLKPLPAVSTPVTPSEDLVAQLRASLQH